MGVVTGNGVTDDDLWLASLSPDGRSRFLYGVDITSKAEHSQGVRLGAFSQAAQCQTCGTICMATHEPMTLTRDGVSWTIPGAWVGPPGDPHKHFFPFPVTGETHPQDNTSQLPTTEPPSKKLPAGITPEMDARAKNPEHRKRIASRSPEARRAEYQRAKRRNRAAAGRL